MCYDEQSRLNIKHQTTEVKEEESESFQISGKKRKHCEMDDADEQQEADALFVEEMTFKKRKI